MFEYEYGKADLTLEEIKEKLYDYLTKSYSKEENTEEKAQHTFEYLKKIVDKIIKREAYKLQFSSGATPLWHCRIIGFLSKWVEAEYECGKILSDQLDNFD